MADNAPVTFDDMLHEIFGRVSWQEGSFNEVPAPPEGVHAIFSADVLTETWGRQ